MSKRDNNMYDLQKAKEEYAEKLKWLLQEYAISQEELANAIGVSKTTITRYCNEICLPHKKTQIKIDSFFRGQNRHLNYTRIPSSVFAGIVYDYLQRFKSYITEQQLAEKVGLKGQSDISKIISDNENQRKAVTTEKQYKILEIFYKLCDLEYGINPHFYVEHTFLKQLLYMEDYEFEEKMFENDNPEYYDDLDCVSDSCIPYILELPIILQSFIYENFEAYFEETMSNVEPYVTDIAATFSERCEWLKTFREMDKEEQQTLIASLEQNTTVNYPLVNHEEKCFFECISAMRRIITSSVPFTSYDKLVHSKPTRNAKAEEKYVKKLTHKIYTRGLYDSSIDELKFKLSFTEYEWYFWMILLINAHNGNLQKLDDMII